MANWENFTSYTTVIWRNLLQSKIHFPINIHENWHEALIPNLTVKWENMWDKTRSKREGKFTEVDDKCLVCTHHILESITHVFWDYRMHG